MSMLRKSIQKSGPCDRVINCAPVLLILTITCWSYYAYVVEFCICTVCLLTEKIIYLVAYHFLILMYFWTYFKTVCTEAGKVPDSFKLPETERDIVLHNDSEEIVKRVLETFAQQLPILNRTVGGAIRYCRKCQHLKPDRTHHCSVCKTCILKMDHHCPWINNCVCYTNYKFFILFLWYALIYCIFISATTSRYFAKFWMRHSDNKGRIHVLLLFFVSLIFAVSLVSLFSYHCYLVACNRTTLEAFRPAMFENGPDKNGFNLGFYENFKQVFGLNVITWFVPIAPGIGDGILFPINARHSIHAYHSMDHTYFTLN